MIPDIPTPAEERVLVQIFSTHNQADLAVSGLEARGIECWTTSDDAGGMLPNLTTPGGVKLFVRKADAEAAATLLNAPATTPEAGPESEAAASPSLARKNLYLEGFIAGCFVTALIGLALFLTTGRQSTRIQRHGELYIYGKNGRVSQHLKDRNLDGQWDYWADYDEHGWVTGVREDNNFDGQPDAFWNYTNGELGSAQFDVDFNGQPDVTYYYKFGIVQRGDWAPNGSTNIIKRYLYTNGIFSQELRDTAGRGYFDQQVLYNPFGDPIKTNVVALPITP
jgi:hypothetical protein